jgi:predicted RNA-binding Zn ribbon-like protein
MEHYSNASSEALEVVLDFVNSAHFDQGEVEEHLDSPDALASFLSSHGLAGDRLRARPSDLRRALEVREAIRDLLAANTGEELNPDALVVLNRAAARSRVVATFDDHASWRIEPASDGVDRAIGRMLATVFQSMSDGSWVRMKACGAPDCRWAFYDGSKNRSGRWCDMSSCGNRMKARAFRERARAAKAGGAHATTAARPRPRANA